MKKKNLRFCAVLQIKSVENLEGNDFVYMGELPSQFSIRCNTFYHFCEVRNFLNLTLFLFGTRLCKTGVILDRKSETVFTHRIVQNPCLTMRVQARRLQQKKSSVKKKARATISPVLRRYSSMFLVSKKFCSHNSCTFILI